jgi:hypothetical protein
VGVGRQKKKKKKKGAWALSSVKRDSKIRNLVQAPKNPIKSRSADETVGIVPFKLTPSDLAPIITEFLTSFSAAADDDALKSVTGALGLARRCAKSLSYVTIYRSHRELTSLSPSPSPCADPLNSPNIGDQGTFSVRQFMDLERLRVVDGFENPTRTGSSYYRLFVRQPARPPRVLAGVQPVAFIK